MDIRVTDNGDLDQKDCLDIQGLGFTCAAMLENKSSRFQQLPINTQP